MELSRTTIFVVQNPVGMAKKKRIIDQIYNGAFENMELSKGSQSAINASALIVGLGIIGAIAILTKKK